VKPGPASRTNRTLTLITDAHGEAELAVAFNVTVSRLEASSGAVIAANGSIRVTVDRPSVSAFGQHVEWKQLPPAATWRGPSSATGRGPRHGVNRYSREEPRQLEHAAKMAEQGDLA
jgi:hypothetical protein